MQQNFGFPNRVGSAPATKTQHVTSIFTAMLLAWIILSRSKVAEKLLSASKGSVGDSASKSFLTSAKLLLISYRFQSFPNLPGRGADTGWLYLLLHHSCNVNGNVNKDLQDTLMQFDSDLLSNVIGFVWQQQQHINIFVGGINEAGGKRTKLPSE